MSKIRIFWQYVWGQQNLNKPQAAIVLVREGDVETRAFFVSEKEMDRFEDQYTIVDAGGVRHPRGIFPGGADGWGICFVSPFEEFERQWREMNPPKP